MEQLNRLIVVAIVVVALVAAAFAVAELIPEMVVDTSYNYPLTLNSNQVATEFGLVGTSLVN